MVGRLDVLQKILKSREERSERQRNLIKLHGGSLISFTLNIPGPTKDKYQYRMALEEGMQALLARLQSEEITIAHKQIIHKETGSEGYISTGCDGLKLKKITVTLEEEHPLGRIFDIDVFDNGHNLISRNDMGIASRKCLLCNEDALICRRTRNHSLEELLGSIEEIISRSGSCY